MLTRPPLVGRSVERAGLEAALDRCRAGEGGVVLVSGDAGVGKSRLVTEVLAGWRGCLLKGMATLGEGVYAPLVEVLRAVTDRFGDDALASPARALLPELAMPWREVDKAALVAGIHRTLRDVARRQPTVVVFEDLHWANAATVDLLPGLAVALAGERLLVVATYRGEELPRTHPVRWMRSELRRAGCLEEYALVPLTGEETGELLASLLDSEVSQTLVTAVQVRADGLPFVVEELAAALVETGLLREIDGVLDLAPDAVLPLPDSVVDAVLVRTTALRGRSSDAVELAAVLGAWVDLPTLADLVDPSDIDRLLEAGLLHEQGDGSAVFRHALVRDALYRAVPWARRRSRHRLIARHLATRGGSPEVIAEHWIAANEPERALPLLLSAAERCCSVHAYRDAAALGRRALAIWPDGVDPDGRVGALEHLAGCAELAGELESAAAVWSEVAQLHRANGDLAGVGAAHRRLANTAGLLGDWQGAVTAREDAAAAYEAAGARGEAAADRLTLAEQLTSAAHHTRALEHAVAAAEHADAEGRTDLKAHALAVQGSIRASLGDWRQGVDLARSGLQLALAEQLTEAAGLSYYEVASALIHASEYAAAADAYESASELCRSHGVTDLAQACVACMSVAVRFMGDWDRALVIAREVLADDHAPDVVRMIAEEESGLIMVLRGDHRRGRRLLRRAVDFGRSNEIFGIEVGATWGIAVAADLSGDSGTADRTVSTLLERCQVKEDWVFALPALRWSATFLATRGDKDALARCHRLLADAATRNSSAKVLSTLAHAGGELALMDGDMAQAGAQFDRAVELLRGITAPFEQALSQLRRGPALAGRDGSQPAVDTVTSAYRTARRLGAQPLARSCAAALAEMGERVDQRLGRLAARALEPARLTRREREVLGLLATGRTNRQIGQDLFVSTRTVDMHVRNLLAKLGCSSRVAAARRASELGLIELTPGA